MTDRKEYIDKAAEQLKEWDNELITLEAKSNLVKEDVKDRFQNKIEDLKVQKSDLKTKLDELKSSGEDAWAVLNKEFTESFEKIKGAFDEAKNIIKN